MAKENKKDSKDEYVGKFKERLGGGRYDPGMADYFMRDGEEVRVFHSFPQEYIYTETECKETVAKSRKNRKQRKPRKSRKQRKTRKQ